VRTAVAAVLGCAIVAAQVAAQSSRANAAVGREVAVERHLRDNDELRLPAGELLAFGRKLFEANWTEQDGGGRPLTKGTGQSLTNPAQPLKGVRGFNRISGPDANSCQGCHNAPFGITGGSGDVVTGAFARADRFDFVTFDRADARATGGAVDERRRPVSLQSVGSVRKTPGLLGAGYIEMLARQITEDLQRTRDSIPSGQASALVSRGLSFGVLARRRDGSWDVSRVEGLSEESLVISAAARKPSLIVRPWDSGYSVSLRQVTNDSFNRHHGIQTTERFGVGTDPDGDGVVNELTRADVTAVTMFQATLAVPGRVIPRDPAVERAVVAGERAFAQIGCTTCHVPSLPLDRGGWIYSEPGPYNPPHNLRRSEVRAVDVDLTGEALPQPRLVLSSGVPAVVHVPAYGDFKIHDITDPADADVAERRFLTRPLWGAASHASHFHHGLFTTMRQALLAHAGEARASRQSFERLTKYEQDALIEFLKTLQVLPPGTTALVVDERYQPRQWPPPSTAPPVTAHQK
jgi:Di-haem oxidoreductase, putative peroxidase